MGIGIEKHDKKRRNKRIAVSILLLVPQMLFLIFSPGLFKDKLNTDPYREWMQFKREPAVGVIKVWHIVGFKPYVGSLGKWLEDTANACSSGYIGIYFEVSSFTGEEAAEQLSRGVLPDVISFSGDRPIELLQCIENGSDVYKKTDIPYCASGTVLVYDPIKADSDGLDELIKNAGTVDEFKKGKAVCSICDIRAAGDLARAQLLGKCPYFEVEPLRADARLVQRLGISAGIDPVKLPYAQKFIETALSPERQSALGRLGLIPANGETSVQYDENWLVKMREIVFESGVFSTF